MNSLEQVLQNGGGFTIAAFIVGMGGFALAPLLALAQATGRRIALFFWLLCPALTLTLCALGTSQGVRAAKLTFTTEGADAIRNSTTLADALSRATASLEFGLFATSLLIAFSAMLQGLATALAKNEDRRITPLSSVLPLFAWTGVLVTTLLLARQAPIPFPWVITIDIIACGIGLSAIGASTSHDEKRAATIAAARFSAASSSILAMIAVGLAGTVGGWRMALKLWSEEPAMFLTMASRATLLTDTYSLYLALGTSGALLSGALCALPVTRALLGEGRGKRIIFALLAASTIGITAAFCLHASTLLLDEKDLIETSDALAVSSAYTLPGSNELAAPESIRSTDLPGCLLLHKPNPDGEDRWEVASAIDEKYNPCGLSPNHNLTEEERALSEPYDKLPDAFGDSENMAEADAREARQLANCPTPLGALEGELCEGMKPAPTILISGDQPASSLASKRWARGWQPLHVLTRAAIPDQEAGSLPTSLRWKVEHESILIDWSPHFAKPEDGVLPEDPEAYRDRAMARKIIFGTARMENPALVAISEDRDGLFAVSLEGVKRITLAPPKETEDEAFDPSAPVPLRQLLDRLHQEYTHDRAQIVVIPAANWDVTRLLEVCSSATAEGLIVAPPRPYETTHQDLRHPSDARAFSRCFVHDIPAAQWFGKVGAVLDAENRVAERDLLLRTIKIEPGLISKHVLHRTIGRKSRSIQKCYEKLIRTRGPLEGRVSVSFELSRSGRASKVNITHDEIGDTPLNTCIIDAIEGARFPRSDNAMQISYPISFKTLG